jgi:hypothetical protein
VIAVQKVCGEHCIAPDEGERLYEEALRALKAGFDVTLDFSGVETLASSFLNVAVGRLYGALDHKFIDAGLHWTGADEADDGIIRLVIRNAKEHYQQSSTQREIQQQIIKSLSQ